MVFFRYVLAQNFTLKHSSFWFNKDWLIDSFIYWFDDMLTHIDLFYDKILEYNVYCTLIITYLV